MFCISRKHLNLRLFHNSQCYLSSLHFALPFKSAPSTLKAPVFSFHELHTIPSPNFSSGSSSLSSRFFNRSDFQWFRRFSSSSRKQIPEIINLIRSGGDENDLQSKLDGMNVSLSEVYIVFRVLNGEKISALRFFDWIRKSNPRFYQNSDVCSLVIDNCGRLNDFDSMFDLLDEFRMHGICLNQKAFGYLPVMISSKAATKNSICKVVQMLNKIGGSCGLSGIHALIEMLCFLDSFEMAEYVIAKTEKRLSNYSLLIRARCRKGHFEEAREILDKMIEIGCKPNCQVYNYILSCLCNHDKSVEAFQLLEFMPKYGWPPDALTYEVLICYLCRHRKLDMAFEWLDRMESEGIEPRATTHAAFIKAYFELQKYQEAHQYVVVCSDKYKMASNLIYSLLANLHRKRGKLVIAQSVLSEMIEKGLKPNFAVYMNVRKQLIKLGREDLTMNLESSFSRFISQPSAVNS